MKKSQNATTVKRMACRLCGRDALQIKGFLKRMNPLGELPAVWECRPSCTADLDPDERVLRALEDSEDV